MGEWQRQQQQRLKPDPKLEPKLDLPPTLKSLAQLQSHFGVFGVSDRGYICLLSVRNTAAPTTEYLESTTLQFAHYSFASCCDCWLRLLQVAFWLFSVGGNLRNSPLKPLFIVVGIAIGELLLL